MGNANTNQQVFFKNPKGDFIPAEALHGKSLQPYLHKNGAFVPYAEFQHGSQVSSEMKQVLSKHNQSLFVSVKPKTSGGEHSIAIPGENDDMVLLDGFDLVEMPGRNMLQSKKDKTLLREKPGFFDNERCAINNQGFAHMHPNV